MSMSAYEHDYIRQAQSRPWYRAYDQRTLDELRPLGRRMLDLTIRYISSRGERSDLIAESREIGHEYGSCSARVGLSTAEALEAFLFFRTPVVQAVTHYIEDENVPTRRAARITSELTYFLDGIRAGYGFPSAYAHPFAIGFALSLLYVLLAHWALAAAVTRSRRTGLLLKVSE